MGIVKLMGVLVYFGVGGLVVWWWCFRWWRV